MDKYAEAAAATKSLAKKFGPDIADLATVTYVDTDQYTVDVLLESGAELFEVQLRALISDNKSIDVLPAKGSYVLVARIDEDSYYVLAADEITNYRVTIGSAIHEITESGHKIVRGGESLKSVLIDLIDQVLEIYAPKDVAGLTAIKQRLNNLLI